jgi:putative heme-binding domain-containing protein
VIAYWGGLPPLVRREAVASLLARTERVGPVVQAVAQGLIAKSDFSSSYANLLRTYPDADISNRSVQMFGPVRGDRPGVLEQYRDAVNVAGDPGRGRQTWLNRCSSCHQLGGEGQRFGPSLDGVRVYGKAAILEATLEPNLRVAPGYGAEVVQTADGQLAMGIVEDETQQELVLRQPAGGWLVVPRANLQSAQREPWSMMPEGLEQGLSVQDLANLLEYLVMARFAGGGL